MRILSLVGSGRRRGNTARIVGFIQSQFEELAAADNEPIKWQTLFLSEVDLLSCTGCRACFTHGEDHCPNHDRLLYVRDAIAAADGVVLASPVYVNDISGRMKTLIDRLGFVCHRPQFFKTPFLSIVTTGGSPARHTLRTLQSAVVSWGAPIGGAAAFVTGALSDTKRIEQHRDCADVLADRFDRQIRERRYEKPSFIALMVFAIQQRAWHRYCSTGDKKSLDSRYWEDSGWLDRGITFFLPHNAPRIRVFLARSAAALLHRFFSG